MKLVILAVPMALQTCGQIGLPLDAKFPAVPQEIVAASNVQLSVIPDTDLSAHDVEVLWKSDRYTCVATKKALKRLILRDVKLAQPKG